MRKIYVFQPFLVSLVVCAGCASTGGEKTLAEDAGPPARDAAAATLFPQVTLSQDYGTLGELVRRVGEEVGGGLVLMHGLEADPAPAVHLRNAPYARLVSSLTSGGAWAAQETAHYYFVHAKDPMYAPLLGLSLQEALPERYAALSASAAFGGGTSLFNALASLSGSLGITLVADNLIADAACGELALPPTPLPALLEAVFKSALLPPGAFAVEATDEYVFFYNTRRPLPGDLLLNRAQLGAGEQALLQRVVSLEVPRATGEMTFYRTASKLGDVLPELSRQLGIPVEAAPAMREFPVNWTVMHDVRVETAILLLIRQWPLDRFGYEVYPDRILIRDR